MPPHPSTDLDLKPAWIILFFGSVRILTTRYEMTEAVAGLIVLIAAGLLGSLLKPTEDETKPLSPSEGGAHAPGNPDH